ncbi:hypothetical protein DL765_009397 [Monosporascus sp. GIB2]|nr:hypothetical protein DL765_009397 [Monosporascus sp. GIB2]
MKDLHLATRQDHLKYGPVIRHGPNKLIFNTSRALHDIYDNERVDKARTYLVSLFTPYHNIFNVIDKDRHRVKRRLIGRVLSESSMRKFEPIMMEQVDIFVQQLLVLSRGSTPVNMSDRCKFIGIDIVGRLAFGYDLRSQTDPKNRHIAKEFKTGNHRLNVYMQDPFLGMLRLEPLAQIINLAKKNSYLRILQRMIKSRLEEEKNAKYDLYSLIADAVDSPSGDNIALSELWSEALFFFPAGGETVTTGMAALFFYLSRSGAAYEKLKTEIRSNFERGSDIKGGPRLAACQYLRACIDEALRLSPPVPGTLWRERSLSDKKPEPLMIDGCAVPHGVFFGVNIYALHHNEEYFPDSFSFKPERWLPSETPEAQRKIMNDAFASFQIGPRGCAGKAMAYLEFSLVIAKTLWYFDLETPSGKIREVGARKTSAQYPLGSGCNEEYQLHDVFTTDHDGPYLILHPHEGFSAELETR